MKIIYKLYHSVFPCLMLTMSVGMIYAFSIFIPEIVDLFGVSRNSIQFSFSLSIFFLGMGAACFGPLVEKNIKMSAVVATALFYLGLYLTHISIMYHSISLLYIGIGVCCGLAEGIAYLCPVKNMVMWFSKSRFKGLVMAVSIVSFGMGATLCTYLYKVLYPIYGLSNIFLVLAFIYLGMMSLGTIAIRKPLYSKRIKKTKPVIVDFKALLTDAYFLKHWLFMFLNISMGLILIGNRKNILMDVGMTGDSIITVFAICGFTNAFGRILFPFIGDFFKNKLYLLPLILGLEFVFISPAIALYSIMPISMILIEGGYGGYFATAPQVLLSQYGKNPLSIVHGLLLSSWGFASLFAFFAMYLISQFTSNYYMLTVVLTIVYGIAGLFALTIRRTRKNILKGE